MQRSLKEHISNPEQKIEALRGQLVQADRTEGELRNFRIDLGIAERSLVYFRKAYELEQKIKY